MVAEERSYRWRIAYLGAAAALFLVDQITKSWAVKALRFGRVIEIVNGILTLVYAENDGIAFGQLQEGGSFSRWFFVVLASLAAIAVLFYFFRTRGNDDRMLGACALLLAGIAGNLTDRTRLGFVIDFILLHYKSFRWPVFNVADASICVGAFLLALNLFFSRNKPPLEKSSD